MNMERTMKLGQLSEREGDARALAIRIHGLKREMRLYLAEHASLESFDAARVRQLSDDLCEGQARYHVLLKEIGELREELGLPRYESR